MRKFIEVAKYCEKDTLHEFKVIQDHQIICHQSKGHATSH